jgi:hypothetical protein
MSKKRREYVTHDDGFRMVWRLSDRRGFVDVDVYRGDSLILEWQYGKVGTLGGTALMFGSTAVIQAEYEERKAAQKAAESTTPKPPPEPS